MTPTPKPPTALPAFVQTEVLRGLQKLLMLRLQGAPPEEGIKLTAAVWLEILAAHPTGWNEAADAGRIQTAFIRLAANAERWPPPKMLIDHLPPRPIRPALEQKRTTSPEEQAKIRQNLAKLRRLLQTFPLKTIE